MRKTTSALLGAAIAGLVSASSLSAHAGGNVKCQGGNGCNGQGGCKTPEMAKEHASTSCKGMGFSMEKNKKDCKAAQTKNAPATPAEKPAG